MARPLDRLLWHRHATLPPNVLLLKQSSFPQGSPYRLDLSDREKREFLTFDGDPLVMPAEAGYVHGLLYEDGVLRGLNERTTKDMRAWCKQHSCTLLPGPPQALSLYDLHGCHPEMFNGESVQNWLMERPFADVVQPGWLALRRDVAPREEIFKKQRKLLPPGDRIPNITELCYAVITLVKLRGLVIGDNVRTRSSTILARSRTRIVLNGFGGEDLFLSCEEDCKASTGLGLPSIPRSPWT